MMENQPSGLRIAPAGVRDTECETTMAGAQNGADRGAPRLLTVAEVADVLRVSTMTVYRLIKSGELSAIRVGKSYRIADDVLQTYLASGEVRIDDVNG